MRNDSDKQVDPINDSDKQVDVIRDSKKLVDAGSDPKSNPSRNPKVDNYTTNGKFTQKSLISRFVPKIIPVAIGPINQLVTNGVSGIQEILGSFQTVLPKASVTDTAHSCARILRTLGKVSRTGRDRSTPRDVNSAKANARLNPPNPSSKPNSISPERTGTQEIFNPRRSITERRSRNAEPLGAPINGFSAVNGHPMSLFRKVIGVETVPRESADTNLRSGMDFASNSVLRKFQTS